MRFIILESQRLSLIFQLPPPLPTPISNHFFPHRLSLIIFPSYFTPLSTILYRSYPASLASTLNSPPPILSHDTQFSTFFLMSPHPPLCTPLSTFVPSSMSHCFTFFVFLLHLLILSCLLFPFSLLHIPLHPCSHVSSIPSTPLTPIPPRPYSPFLYKLQHYTTV